MELGRTLTKLTKRQYTTSVSAASIFTTDGRQQAFNFGPGVTIVCGGNGAGKSTTLGALWRCLSSSAEGPTGLPQVPPWITSLELGGFHSGAEWHASYEVTAGTFSGACPAPAYYLDPAAYTEELIGKFRSDDHPEDLIAGIDPATLDPRLVEMLSLTLRREYDELLVYEVTAFSQEDDPIPFFRVSSAGKSYDLLNMGRGEMCAVFLVWKLSLLEPGSIVLIEEPECHLANYSQRRLLDVLVHFAVDRDLTIIASSHSPGLFQPLPDDHAVLVATSPLAGFRTGLSTAELADLLGLEGPGRVAIVVLEDQAASGFLLALMEHLDRELLKHVGICYARSGASGVQRVVSEIERIDSSMRYAVVGILDGDQRVPPEGDALAPIEYLPGDDAPELVIRKVLNDWRSQSPRAWNPPLAGGSAALEIELDKVDGLDHHDWLYDLGRRYGGLNAFISAVTGLVLEDANFHTQAVALISWLRGFIRT